MREGPGGLRGQLSGAVLDCTLSIKGMALRKEPRPAVWAAGAGTGTRRW